MARALTSLCLLLVVVLTGGQALAGKEKIAILGLEVVGGSGTIDAESTRVAQDFTVALRTQPRAGRGVYQWTPGSEKELVDEKILADCQTEDKSCMAKIGSNLGADVLVYGRVERKALGGVVGYQISLKFLKVATATQMQGWTDLVPIADANGTKLQDWARKAYKKLTNDFDGGTLRIRIKNEGVDRGTILIEGEERGNITSGTGEVSSLPEGRYKVSVVVSGFDRWDSTEKITIRNGDTTTEEITLRKGRTVPCDPMVSKDCGGTISDDGPKTGKWKALMVVGILVGGAGGGLLYLSGDKVDEANAQTDTICMTASRCNRNDPDFKKFDDQGKKFEKLSYVGGGLIAIGSVMAVVGVIKGFVVKGGKEKIATRKAPARDFVVTPVVTDRSAGATLLLTW